MNILSELQTALAERYEINRLIARLCADIAEGTKPVATEPASAPEPAPRARVERKPRPAATKRRAAPSVSEDTLGKVHAELIGTPQRSEDIANAAGVSKPVALRALGALAAAGRAVKHGDKRSTRWSRAVKHGDKRSTRWSLAADSSYQQSEED
jgi:hypothetical protein